MRKSDSSFWLNEGQFPFRSSQSTCQLFREKMLTLSPEEILFNINTIYFTSIWREPSWGLKHLNKIEMFQLLVVGVIAKTWHFVFMFTFKCSLVWRMTKNIKLKTTQNIKKGLLSFKFMLIVAGKSTWRWGSRDTSTRESLTLLAALTPSFEMEEQSTLDFFHFFSFRKWGKVDCPNNILSTILYLFVPKKICWLSKLPYLKIAFFCKL
jgi:hypothetical protein